MCPICGNRLEGRHKYCSTNCRQKAWLNKRTSFVITEDRNVSSPNVRVEYDVLSLRDFVQIHNDLIDDHVITSLEIGNIPMIFGVDDKHGMYWDSTNGHLVITDILKSEY